MTARRDRDGERRAIDARQHAERAVRGDDRRARMTGAEERRRLAARRPVWPRRRSTPAACGAAPPPAHRSSRSTSGASTTRTRLRSTSRMPGELGLDQAGRPDERHAEVEMPRGRQGAVDDVTRREVAAHGVNCDPDHDRVRCHAVPGSVLSAGCCARCHVPGAVRGAGCQLLGPLPGPAPGTAPGTRHPHEAPVLASPP